VNAGAIVSIQIMKQCGVCDRAEQIYERLGFVADYVTKILPLLQSDNTVERLGTVHRMEHTREADRSARTPALQDVSGRHQVRKERRLVVNAKPTTERNQIFGFSLNHIRLSARH